MGAIRSLVLDQRYGIEHIRLKFGARPTQKDVSELRSFLHKLLREECAPGHALVSSTYLHEYERKGGKPPRCNISVMCGRKELPTDGGSIESGMAGAATLLAGENGVWIAQKIASELGLESLWRLDGSGTWTRMKVADLPPADFMASGL